MLHPLSTLTRFFLEGGPLPSQDDLARLIPKPGILSGDAYLSLPSDTETWLVRPLIPAGGSAVLYGDPKLGKALSLDTPLYTPLGWRTIADIQKGDEVYSSQGKPIKVLAISDVVLGRPCFRVTFADGHSLVTDAEHEWEVTQVCGKNCVVKVVTTRHMFTRGIGDTDRNGDIKARWRVQLPQPLELPALQQAPWDLAPYLLGLWLGDGTASNSTYTTMDQELVDAWANGGWLITKHASQYHYGIRMLSETTKKLGVFQNKHIPDQYMKASIEDRLALLQGLLDTDGDCYRRVANFYNKNERLARQTYELAVSLGLKVKFHTKRAKLYGKDCGPFYTVSIRSSRFPLFRLTRKAARFLQHTEDYWSITSIEPVPSVPVKCLVVDAPDHLFLVGQNCLPTHNSYMSLQLAFALAGAQPDFLGFPVVTSGPVAYIQFDTPRNVWQLRLRELKAGGHPVESVHYADRQSIKDYPFDILQPAHVAYLKSIVVPLKPIAVIIDTIRDSHSGDEDSSTEMRNVIVNFRAALGETAIILISHARKPSPEVERNILADMRGSSAVVGSMDVIMRLTKRALYYVGRSIEEGSIRLQRQDNGLWLPDEGDTAEALARVLSDTSLTTLRAKARALAPMIKKTDEAAMSMLRRATEAIKANGIKPKRQSVVADAVTKIVQSGVVVSAENTEGVSQANGSGRAEAVK